MRLRYQPPFDWEALLAFLRPRATPGIELVEDGAYRRSVTVDGHVGWMEVAPSPHDTVRLDVHGLDALHMPFVAGRVRAMFDLDANPATIEDGLARDSMLRPLVARRPGLRVPGAWDGFELGVRAILGQQVSVAAATTLAGRLVSAFGRPMAPGAGANANQVVGVTHTFPSPGELSAAAVETIGLPGARANAIRAFSAAVARGEVLFAGEPDASAIRRQLRRLPGIGEWTAEYIALRALGDRDAFPAGDLGLLRAAGMTDSRRLLARAEAWRPWRAYAAVHFWTAGAASRTKTSTHQ